LFQLLRHSSVPVSGVCGEHGFYVFPNFAKEIVDTAGFLNITGAAEQLYPMLVRRGRRRSKDHDRRAHQRRAAQNLPQDLQAFNPRKRQIEDDRIRPSLHLCGREKLHRRFTVIADRHLRGNLMVMKRPLNEVNVRLVILDDQKPLKMVSQISYFTWTPEIEACEIVQVADEYLLIRPDRSGPRLRP
jgi:hypothetical protein